MTGMKTFLLAFGAAAAAIVALAPALGQSSALKGHNSNAPVDVAADRIEVQDRADRAIFSGNVVVRQAELTLNAPRLTVAYSNAGGIEIDRIDASGGVTVRSPSETATGQYLGRGTPSRPDEQHNSCIRQCRTVRNPNHALCWVYAERLLQKMMPKTPEQTRKLEKVRNQIWALYGDLKLWKQKPCAKEALVLTKRFDDIFGQRTRYKELGRLLARLHRRKSELLKVLERPEIPLHTNASENDLRASVTKRRISGGTMSADGRQARRHAWAHENLPQVWHLLIRLSG